MKKEKYCKQCKQTLLITLFRERQRNGRLYYETLCKKCECQNNKIRFKKRYISKGRAEFLDKYYNDLDFKQSHLERARKWEKNNKEKRKKYKEKLGWKQWANEWQKNRRKYDPLFKMRSYISNNINNYLRINKSSKNSQSCLNYLPYTFDELKSHLESQFEPWMNWENWGKYKVDEWDDNDSSTWKWQIDHIIPHSEFNYISMEDENFKKCWALDNLRPLNAKQNLIDGCKRTRHGTFMHKST